MLQILFIDDDERDYLLIVRHLRKAGLLLDSMRVDDEPGLDAALENLYWDLVLSDYGLPGFDTSRALAMVRRADPDLPFILLSGTIGEEQAVELLKAGADDFVYKENPVRLVPVIERAVRDARERRKRRAVEHDLTESEQRLSALFQHSPVASSVGVLPDGRLIDVNDEFLAMTGYAWEEVIGHTWDELGLVPQGKANEGLPQLEETGSLRDLELEFVTKSGDRRHFLLHAESVDIGGMPHLLGKILDITERKRAEEALAEREARLAEAQRIAHLGSWELDLGTGVALWSDEEYRILGYEPGAVESDLETYLRAVHPEDLDAVKQEMEAATNRSDGSYTIEHRVVLAEGRERVVLDRGHVCFDDNGQPVRMTGTTLDVTEQKETERKLRESEARFKGLLVALPHIAVQGYDRDRRVTFWNAASERLYGYTAEDALGSKLEELIFPSAARDEVVARIRDWIELDRPIPTGELGLRRKDGSIVRVFSSHVMQCDSAGNPVLYCIGVDLTEIHRAQERLRQSATVFESTTEGVIITDAVANIVDVNRAFTDITGYSREDVLGKNPRLLQSGRHDSEFYESMWASIVDVGHWRGEVWNRRKDGCLFPEWLTISSVQNESGRVSNYVAVFSDVTSIKSSQAKLEHLAHHDPLTGLPNRLLFGARVNHSLERAERSRSFLAVLFLDLDHFKNINDSLGHPAGDDLLKEVADRLSRCVRQEDTVARIGGDEFTFLLENIREPANAASVADKVLQAFSLPFEVDGRELYITCSIGISVYPRDGKDGDVLLRNADAAMYRSKERGRNAYTFYTEELTARAIERVTLENDLRTALKREQLQLHFQPQLRLDTGEVVGAEALLRWEHPDMGAIAPSRFIPLAENSGLILSIGEFVLHSVCFQARAWLDSGLAIGRVAVNISGRQIGRSDLVKMIQAALDASGLPSEYLELEVTESLIMGEAEQIIDVLDRLRALGVRLSIDDFGTGCSSLAYLKRLPIDRLKIDRSFVRDIPRDPNDVAIARTVIALGASLQLEVLAEGVETEEQRRFLLDEGCTYGQGNLFQRPLASDEFYDYARKQKIGR